MNDVTSAGAAAPIAEPVAAPSASAQIATAVEKTVEQTLATIQSAGELTPAQKQALASGLYTTWRNQNLRGLPTAAFAKVEGASAALIAAIAAAL